MALPMALRMSAAMRLVTANFHRMFTCVSKQADKRENRDFPPQYTQQCQNIRLEHCYQNVQRINDSINFEDALTREIKFELERKPNQKEFSLKKANFLKGSEIDDGPRVNATDGSISID